MKRALAFTFVGLMSLVSVTARADYWAIPATSCSITPSQVGKANSYGHQLSFYSSQTGEFSAVCPIHIPDYENIDSFTMYSQGDSDGTGTSYRVRVVLRKVDLSSGSWVDVAGIDSSTSSYSSTTSSPNESVDNSSYAYYFFAYFYRSGTTSNPTLHSIRISKSL